SKTLEMIMLLVGIVLVLVYSYFYRQEARHARRLTRRQKNILRLLRCVVALLALLAIARPAVTLIRVEKRLPVTAFVVDESSSMGFPDSRDNPFVQANPITQRTRYDTAKTIVGKLQEPLTLTHRVKVYKFSDILKLVRELPFRENKRIPAMPLEDVFRGSEKPTGEYTNIGDALLDVLRNLAGEKISAVILISDGRQTGGIPLERAGQQIAQADVPVHAITLGTEFPLRDLRIDEVAVPPEASLGDVLIFDLKVENQIQNQLVADLTLLEQGKQVAAKKVLLKRGENRVSIATIPEVEGQREFRLKLPVYPDEVNTENNEATVHVTIVKKTLRVLLIASDPTREYFYMVPALLRDPVVELATWLQCADVDYVQQGNVEIKRLPETLADWQRYDVCILFDPDPNKLTTQQVTGIENMVRKGGGLIFIAGRNHGLAKLIQVHAVKIRNLLPVEIDKNVLPNYYEYFERPFAVERTPKGRGHPIMMASSDGEENERIWKTFPRFWWCHPVVSAKPGTVVLLQKAGEGALGSDTTPVMAIQRYGEGAVFYSGVNSLWLWRFPYESFDYDRLWNRVVRYLGETRLRGTQQQVSLSTDRNIYTPGEEVEIRLRILDPALMAQLENVPLFASVITPQKDEQMVPLSPDRRGEMLYRGKYQARRVGSMLVRARQSAPESDTEAKALFDVTHAFQVKMQSLEEKDTSGNLDAMRALAEQTGGKYFDYRNMKSLEELVKAIPTEPQRLSKAVLVEIWDGVAFLLLFLILISAEWSLRKWWGLL
ncbi:MAG: VWA domain-containing protein, partial [Kiritimatiellia bacterium]